MFRGEVHRNGTAVSHLDPRVLEQWVFKHWKGSEYWGYPLKALRSELRTFSTEEFLIRVGSSHLIKGDDSLDQIFEGLNRCRSRGNQVEPMRSINANGTWNFPPLVLHHPHGFVYRDVLFPNHPYWLIEGHLRFRYLRAAFGRIELKPRHEVLVLFDTENLSKGMTNTACV